MIDVLELTRRLVAAESPTGAEGPATELLAAELAALGYQVQRQPVSAGRDNLYAFREPPVVVFSTHLDTVPPHVPLREDERWIHGRGSCDAKGLGAAMVAAAEQLAGEGERRIGLLFVVGEENGSDGARAAERLEPKGRFVINGEPTENQLSIGQKGALRVDITASGRAAHSAYPEEGSSAIVPLLETLRRIRRLPLPFDPLLGSATLNIGLIGGGVAPNVIPAEAQATVLVRTVVPSGPLREAISACAEPGVTIAFGHELPPYKGSAVTGWDTTVVSFASDVPFLTSWGTVYQLGPGSIRVAHTDEERIDKAELIEGVNRYARLARTLLSSSSGVA